MTGPGRARRFHLGAALLLLAAAWVLDGFLTRSMAWHMLVHIPMLIAAAAWAAAGLAGAGSPKGARPGSAFAALGKYNEHGLPGLLLFSFIGAYWMIPRSLDDAVTSAASQGFKYATLVLAGMLLIHSLRRANAIIVVFFLGNFSWMTAIVGLLYQEYPARLCNVYLLGDQEIAGRGLVAWAILLPLAWFMIERRRPRSLLAGADAPTVKGNTNVDGRK
ncbi:MAG: hypothetical protein OZ927_02630 [Alcaligenaceae bacterium]|nr:hypothetical protein [Alcaligenaceae bacterium]